MIYPAHGPPLVNQDTAFDRFKGHRLVRIRQVREAMMAHSDGDEEGLLDIVYGDAVPATMRCAARTSLSELVEYVHGVLG